jgi:hypothetical protein
MHIQETSLPPPDADHYTNWGTFRSGSGRTSNEPNNAFGSEFCTAANFTETSGGNWMWSDTLCEGQQIVFICMIKRELQLALLVTMLLS